MSSPYDLFAAAYDDWKKSDRYDLLCDMLTEFIAAKVPAAKTGVDFGCGTGRLTALLAGQGFNMVGVDQSLAMLTRARTRMTPNVSYDHASFIDWVSSVEADFVIATSDTFDHVIEDTELVRSFISALASLRADGLSIYDANGPVLFDQPAIEASTPDYAFTGRIVQTEPGRLSHRILISQRNRAPSTVVVNQKLRTPAEHADLLTLAGFDRVEHLSIARTPYGLTLAFPPRDYTGRFFVRGRRPAVRKLPI